MYEIRKIHSNEVMEALALALEVFLQFEAPDYKPEGIETFKRDIVENDEFISKCQQGICPIYAAFDKGKMIGIIGMYSNRKHILRYFINWFIDVQYSVVIMYKERRCYNASNQTNYRFT